MANKNDEMRFEDVSSYSSSREYKKKKKNRRGRTVLKSIMGVFSVLLIIFGAGLIYISTDLLAGLSTVSISKDKSVLGISPDATTHKDITNIALFGVDGRDGSFNGLADTIMVLSIDNKNNKIKMTSILRDSVVLIDGYGYNKINASYSNGTYPDDGGPELAIRTINQNFMLNITDYVTINFGNLAEVVDAFGGTEIEVSDDEAYQINENLNSLMYEQIHDGYEQTIFESDFLPSNNGYVTGGNLTLNGNQAVAYARNRSDSTGDSGRADRQKKVLMGLFAKLTTMGTGDYYSLAQNIFPKCETSFQSFQDIWGFAPILSKDFTIETLNIPGIEENPTGQNNGDYLGWHWSYDLDLAAQHIDRFINEEDSPYYDATLGSGADNWDE